MAGSRSGGASSTFRAASAHDHGDFAPVPGEKDMLAIWADPKVTGRDHPLHAPLGSTGSLEEGEEEGGEEEIGAMLSFAAR